MNILNFINNHNTEEVVFLNITGSNATLLYLSWVPESGVPVTTYIISYSNTNKKCFIDSKSDKKVDNETLNYTLQDLQEHTEYLVKVAVVHDGRIVGSTEIMTVTKPAGMYWEYCGAEIIIEPLSAPSAPPSSVTVTGVTSSTISVQWGSVPCIHQNGDITGYTVQYGLMGSGEKPVTMSASGGSKTEVTLSNLTAETSYWVTVAVVNTEGTGESRNISAKTSAGTVTSHYCAHVELTQNGVCIPIKESTTTSGIGAAVVAPAAGSVIGFLLLLSVIIVLLILFIRYKLYRATVYTNTMSMLLCYKVEEVSQRVSESEV